MFAFDMEFGTGGAKTVIYLIPKTLSKSLPNFGAKTQ